MTNQQKSQRTRRRFLADMLFLGGGLTATAIIAKTQMAGASPTDGAKPSATSTPHSAATPVENPQIIAAGEMVAPEPPNPAGGKRAPSHPIDRSPDIEGDFAMPEAQPSPPPRPHIKGKVAAPEAIAPSPGEPRPVKHD